MFFDIFDKNLDMAGILLNQQMMFFISFKKDILFTIIPPCAVKLLLHTYINQVVTLDVICFSILYTLILVTGWILNFDEKKFDIFFQLEST